MNKLLLMTVLGLTWATVCLADDTYLGKLSTNPYGADSTSNAYGAHGSEYSSDSINNEYGLTPHTDPNKIRITIRLDGNIIEYFKKQVNDAGGGNYQTLLNDALRSYIHSKIEPLEDTLRKVIREELKLAK